MSCKNKINLEKKHTEKSIINCKQFNLSRLPSKISIATIASSCKLDAYIDLDNVNRYLKLSKDDIITVKYNKEIRSLDEKVLKKRKKKNPKRFLNQVTIEVMVPNGTNKTKKLNMKLFCNGSIQMSGSKNILQCDCALRKLLNKLIKPVTIDDTIKYFVFNEIEDGKIIHCKDLNVKTFKINMINTSFSVNYLINRDKLYELLLDNDVNCKYETVNHAAVIIYHTLKENSNRIVTALVFESGKIIITGAKNKEEIIETFDYVSSTLIENRKRIMKTDITLLSKDVLMDLLKD
jgi:TATA-box binding protein (TBP) (component of TFIID and TFIIIB)